MKKEYKLIIGEVGLGLSAIGALLLSDNNLKATSLNDLKEEISIQKEVSPVDIEKRKHFNEIDTNQNIYFGAGAKLWDEPNGNVIKSVTVYDNAFEYFTVNNWSLVEYKGELYYVPTIDTGILEENSNKVKTK
ncbi:MAG: hypothetical protein IJ565_04980 [Bacilli bacterium]|nr:hypothetical protein [Bacilli bacterium]